MKINNAVTISFLFVISGAATSSFSMPTPKYLSIPSFEKCLHQAKEETWTHWCVPEEKPSQCSDDSWAQLHSLKEKDQIPACVQATLTEKPHRNNK